MYIMSKMICEGCAEQVLSEKNNQILYMPHHDIYHSQKRNIKVVSECSARHLSSR